LIEPVNGTTNYDGYDWVKYYENQEDMPTEPPVGYVNDWVEVQPTTPPEGFVGNFTEEQPTSAPDTYVGTGAEFAFWGSFLDGTFQILPGPPDWEGIEPKPAEGLILPELLGDVSPLGDWQVVNITEGGPFNTIV